MSNIFTELRKLANHPLLCHGQHYDQQQVEKRSIAYEDPSIPACVCDSLSNPWC